VVPVNYNLPNVPHEKLANLFLYNENKENTEIEEFIEDISLFLTGNWDNEDPFPDFQKSLKAAKWRPKGTIEAQDHQLGQLVPVKGVKVSMRNWFKYSLDYTDQNGYYESSKEFKKKVQYKIKWVTPNYRIRSGFYGVAWTVGPKQRNDWNVSLTQNLRHFYASIHIAAHDFYSNNSFGLKKPNPTPKLKIAALDQCGEVFGTNLHFASILGGPDIRVFRKGSTCLVKNSLSIYSTTIHELGHSSHRATHFWSYIFKNTDFTRESWARCIQWAFVMEKYYPNTLYSVPTKKLFLTTATSTTIFDETEALGVGFNFNLGATDYTTFFIDLIDRDETNSINVNYPLEDRVENYTLGELQNALTATGWKYDTPKNINAIRNYLKNNYSNPSEIYLDKYVEPYILNY
jgi:hypothetical protein